MKALPAEALEALRDPTISLPAYAKIIDQKTGREIRYDPYAITDKLQATVVGYYSNPPVTDMGQSSGSTCWATGRAASL